MHWLALLRGNPAFCRLWSSQCISSIGDWFNHIAIINMVIGLTGSGLSVAVAITCRTIPLILIGPWLGARIDRSDKKQLLIGADVLRALLASGYLLVDKAGDLWIVYLLSACLGLCTVAFDAARMAYLPQVVAAEKLITANSIFSFSFGGTVAFGALTGGWIVSMTGNNSAFLFNAATFAVSGLLLSGIQAAEPARHKQHRRLWTRELGAALQWLAHNRLVLLVLLTDAGLAVCSGIMNVLLGVFALQVFMAGSFGLGILYLALGLGFIAGSLGARKFSCISGRQSQTVMSWLFVSIGAAVIAFSQCLNLAAAAGSLLALYLLQAIFGILYNTVLMLLIPAGLQGKLFALDKIKLAVIMSISALLAGGLLEITAPRLLGLATGSLTVGCGLACLVIGKFNQADTGERIKQDGDLSA